MKTDDEQETIVIDMFGNEIVDGMELTIPADIAEEHGADETDNIEDFIGEDD